PGQDDSGRQDLSGNPGEPGRGLPDPYGAGWLRAGEPCPREGGRGLRGGPGCPDSGSGGPRSLSGNRGHGELQGEAGRPATGAFGDARGAVCRKLKSLSMTSLAESGSTSTFGPG